MRKSNILVIIPARKGSKGIPSKNKKELLGKPLICYTFDIASKLSDNFFTYVSSDDEEILNIAKDYKIKNNGLRPLNLSSDQALTIDVIKHELEIVEKNNNLIFDAILLLQPTCPIRQVNHILEAEKLLEQNGDASIISVEKIDSNHPFRMKRIENGFLINFIDQGFEDMRPRQHLPTVYIRNGSIYLTPRNIIVEDHSMVSNKTIPIIMDERHSVNIDTYIDFLAAEYYLSQ
jgi:CMP-N,N'-diacetyllegionaminic acid synthase